MSTLAVIIATAVVVAVVIAYAAAYLRNVIEDDGAHGPRRTPPASHHADFFDPRGRVA